MTLVSVSGNENIYVYENLTGGDKTNATGLEIEALYNGAPTKYRVYINEHVPSLVNDHPYEIKRNYAYVLTGTIKSMGKIDGLTLTTNVLPWEKVSSEIRFDWDFEIEPYPTPGNKTFTVNSPADEIQFTFKLTNPIDAVWIANLTNPDFTITNHRGVTDETVTITIKAKKEQSTAERIAEFYIIANYGGSSTEIPLLNGTTSVGSGNRIVIRQPALN